MTNKVVAIAGFVLIVTSVPAFAAGYRVVDLTPSGALESSAAAANLGFQGGNVTVGYYRVSCGPRRFCTVHQTSGAFWGGSAASFLNLNPTGYFTSTVAGIGGSLQVGYGLATQPLYSGNQHALMWKGTAGSMVDLHPSGFRDSQAYATDGTTEVGSAVVSGVGPHAAIWFGSASSMVDLNPAGQTGSEAFSIGGGKQVGYGILNGVGQHAYVWTGTAGSAVDVNPTGYEASVMKGVDGNLEVGFAVEPVYHMAHAFLWTGTSRKGVDLNPSICFDSYGTAIRGNTEVGFGASGQWSTYSHALVWKGSAASFVDLHQYLPVGYNQSFAYGIDQNGNIVGVAYDANFKQHAIEWIPIASARHRS